MFLKSDKSISYLKIGLLGEEHCGKSCILELLKHGKSTLLPTALFGDQSIISSIENTETFHYQLLLDPSKPFSFLKLTVEISELAGNPSYEPLLKSFIQACDAFFLVINPRRFTSLESVWQYYQAILKVKCMRVGQIPCMVLLAHQSDLRSQSFLKLLSLNTLQEFSQIISVPLIETSCYEPTSLFKALNVVIQNLQIWVNDQPDFLFHHVGMPTLLNQPPMLHKKSISLDSFSWKKLKKESKWKPKRES
jgi:GTPase SAR1 family protein